MQRITLSVDDELADVLDRHMRTHRYASRSEALRDILRGVEARQRLGDGGKANGFCVATLAYVYDHETRGLGQRLTQSQHRHHDLQVATLHVHLDHDFLPRGVGAARSGQGGAGTRRRYRQPTRRAPRPAPSRAGRPCPRPPFTRRRRLARTRAHPRLACSEFRGAVVPAGAERREALVELRYTWDLSPRGEPPSSRARSRSPDSRYATHTWLASVHTGPFQIDLPKVAGVNCGKTVIRRRLLGRQCQTTVRPTSGGTHVGQGASRYRRNRHQQLLLRGAGAGHQALRLQFRAP